MKTFSEELRYDLPLTPDSVVLDVGAYHGNWSRLISEKYRCKIIAFEPIGEFYRIAKKNLEGHPNVRLFNLGVGGSTRKETLRVKGDMTGAFADGPPEEVEIRDVVEVLDEFGRVKSPSESTDGTWRFDAMKINSEGAEFEILERLLDSGFIGNVNHLSVQPHACVPDHEARWQRIMDRMAETHTLVYNSPWVWVGWDRK
jgi:FkbM family methyltransferase